MDFTKENKRKKSITFFIKPKHNLLNFISTAKSFKMEGVVLMQTSEVDQGHWDNPEDTWYLVGTTSCFP